MFKCNSLETQAVSSEAAFKTYCITTLPFKSIRALTLHYPSVHSPYSDISQDSLHGGNNSANCLNSAKSVTDCFRTAFTKESIFKAGVLKVLALNWHKVAEYIRGSWRWSAWTLHMHHVKRRNLGNDDLPTSCEVRTLQMSLWLTQAERTRFHLNQISVGIFAAIYNN